MKKIQKKMNSFKYVDNNISNFEKQIFFYINQLRINTQNFCNELLKNNKSSKIKNILEGIKYTINHNNIILHPYIEIIEISSAARNLINIISKHYQMYHNINIKDINSKYTNLKNRLENYGKRTGKIFETVLFKLTNAQEVIFNILKDERGRNSLLSNKMKYIGIACDFVAPETLCIVIDIVQDFSTYKYIDNDNKSYDIKFNYKDTVNIKNCNKLKTSIRQNFIPNINKDGLLYELNNRNNKDNLKLNIVIPEKKVKEPKKDLKDNTYGKINTTYKNFYYKKKSQKGNKLCFTPDIKKVNNYNKPIGIDEYIKVKKIIPKNTSYIKTNENKLQNNEYDVNDIKFTIAGRTPQQQEEVVGISNKNNLNKSKSVNSYDIISNHSRASNTTKYQRLKHEEKMEILHKINQLSYKSPKSPTSPIIHNIDNIHFDENKVKKTPSKITNDNEYYYYDVNSEKGICLSNKDGSLIDIKSCKDMENFSEYSRNKIDEIKDDLLVYRDQLKKELKEEVREEVREELRKEFSNQIFNKQIIKNQPIIIKLDKGEEDLDKKNEFDERKIYSDNNEIIYNDEYNNIFYNKKKETKAKGRWSLNQNYYYIKTNNNNVNNNLNDNIYISTHKQIIKKKNSFDYTYKGKIQNENLYKKNHKYYGNASFDINMGTYKRNNQEIENDIKSVQSTTNNKESYNYKNRQEIKKLIRLYNIAKDEKKNLNIIENSSNNPYDIITNNKSISNYNFIPNDESNINNSTYTTYNNYPKDNTDILKYDKYSYDNTHNRKNKILNNEKNVNKNKYDENEDYFVKGHKFQIKYEKVKPKSQLYKSPIPKLKSTPNILNANDISQKDKNFITFNTKKDVNNDDNNNLNIYEFTSKGFDNTKNKSNYMKKYNELIKVTYENKSMLDSNKDSPHDKLSITGRFQDENNDYKDYDVRSALNKEINYNIGKEEKIISKTEKIEGNNLVTTIVTKTKEIYTPDNNKEKFLNFGYSGKNKPDLKINLSDINNNFDSEKKFNTQINFDFKNLADKERQKNIYDQKYNNQQFNNRLNAIRKTPDHNLNSNNKTTSYYMKKYTPHREKQSYIKESNKDMNRKKNNVFTYIKRP